MGTGNWERGMEIWGTGNGERGMGLIENEIERRLRC